jgi:hypothetical protein
MSAPTLQNPSPPGARLADSEEQRRHFTLPPLRRLFPMGRSGSAHREFAEERREQNRALQLGRGAFLLFLALAALLILAVVLLWLVNSPSPAGVFWSHRLPRLG